MTFYNMACGFNPLSPVLMDWLGLDFKKDVGRFRDCYPADVRGELHIVVFTRNGGGNRADYEDVFTKLRAHPDYLRDWDEPFDSTYAHIEFKAPAEYAAESRDLLDILRREHRELLKTPMENFHEALDNLRSDARVSRKG